MTKWLRLVTVQWDKENDIRHFISTIVLNPTIEQIEFRNRSAIKISGEDENSESVVRIIPLSTKYKYGDNRLFTVLDALFYPYGGIGHLIDVGLDPNINYVLNDNLYVELDACVKDDEETGDTVFCNIRIALVNGFKNDPATNPLVTRTLTKEVYEIDLYNKEIFVNAPLSVFRQHPSYLRNITRAINKENKHEELLTDMVGKEAEFMEDETEENSQFDFSGKSWKEIQKLIPELVAKAQENSVNIGKFLEHAKELMKNTVACSNSENHNVVFEIEENLPQYKSKYKDSKAMGKVELLNVLKAQRCLEDKEEIPHVRICNYLFPGKPTQAGQQVTWILEVDTKHYVYQKCTTEQFKDIAGRLRSGLDWFFKELLRIEFRERVASIKLEIKDSGVWIEAKDIQGKTLHSAYMNLHVRVVHYEEFRKIVTDVDFNVFSTASTADTESDEIERPVKDAEYSEESEDSVEPELEDKNLITVSASDYANGYIEFRVKSLNELNIHSCDYGIWLTKTPVYKSEEDKPWEYAIPLGMDKDEVIVLGNIEDAVKYQNDMTKENVILFLNNLEDDVRKIEIKISPTKVELVAKNGLTTIASTDTLCTRFFTIGKGLALLKDKIEKERL